MGNVSLPPLHVQNSASVSTDTVSTHSPSQKLSRRSDIPSSISIVSNSHLLQEALIRLIRDRWSIADQSNAKR